MPGKTQSLTLTLGGLRVEVSVVDSAAREILADSFGPFCADSPADGLVRLTLSVEPELCLTDEGALPGLGACLGNRSTSPAARPTADPGVAKASDIPDIAAPSRLGLGRRSRTAGTRSTFGTGLGAGPGYRDKLLGLRYQRADLAFEMDADRTSACARVDGSRGALEAAVELALQGALLLRGGLVVHAVACVDDSGQGWLVPGRSGAGKSTIARTAGFPRALADEAVILRRVAGPGGGFALHGTPFWSEGRTRPLDTGSAPLRFLARPVQSTFAELRPLPAAEAAAALLACVLFHEHASNASARQLALETACDAAATAECVELHFPKEGPWLNGVARRRAEWARSSTAR